ncbi:hypothetical protein BGZ93_009042 [Podila epicladia]|nr:hypothetical protein BGZ93_009042 [Podila epicladia]
MHEFAHVAPVCKLSCIKSLNLAGTAAQQFNSLDYYTGLEALITESNSEFGRSMPIGSNILLCSKDDSAAPSIISPRETQPAALNARPQNESKLKSIILKGITVYTPSVTALQMERIEDGLDLVGHGGTQYEDQCCKRSSKLWTIIAAAIKRSRQADLRPHRGFKLRNFSCDTLSRSGKKELGMSALARDQVYQYRQAGKLIVATGRQHYIRKEDKL